tara:strand:- start:482 stop:730 length:249 start_codon:yes stop_codon:yes gene_type:complete
MKFLNYELLEHLNRESLKAKRNRNLYVERLPIDKEKLYPIADSMLHNDSEVRCRIVLNEQGQIAYLDISTAEYNALPDTDGL